MVWRPFRQLQPPMEAGPSGVVLHRESRQITHPLMVPFGPSNPGLSKRSTDCEILSSCHDPDMPQDFDQGAAISVRLTFLHR